MASAPQRAPGSGLPTLIPEPIKGLAGYSFYAIEGAFIVVDGLRVGRIVDDKVEWLDSLPEMNGYLGGSQITGMRGIWPDLDVEFSSNNGRASQPSLYPLTGKGSTVTFADGGGLGWISGSGRIGQTTIVGGYDMWAGSRIVTMRGPGLVIKPITAEKGGCKEDEAKQQLSRDNEPIAVPFSGLAVSEKGTLVTVGNLCDRPKTPVAEVWDQPGKSRIVDLGAWVKDLGYFSKFLKGKGDDLFLVSNDPVLHYHDGKFEPLPKVERPFSDHFVSPAGKLHGIAGRTIYRYDEGKWTAIANLSYPRSFSTVAMDDQGTIWVSYDGVSRLRPSKDADLEGDCKTPFVYLYAVSWKNEVKYTFPTTRKALASFPQVSEIKLVEYWEDGRRLGVEVKSKEQGEAVVEHIKATMKDEHPELFCYVPRKPRYIEIKDGK